MKTRTKLIIVLATIVAAYGMTNAAYAQSIDRTSNQITGRYWPTQKHKEYPKESFSYFVQHFPLKDISEPSRTYDGQIISQHPWGVFDIDVSEYQQCADAIIRLRAEYLWKTRQYSKIHFNFANGFTADYTRWARGERIIVEGNECRYVRSNEEDWSYQTFKKYLKMVFCYANTWSLSKELLPVSGEAEVGDILIIGGFPGHAAIIVDKVETDTHGEYYIMVAQSWMPAQDIEIVIPAIAYTMKDENGSHREVFHNTFDGPYQMIHHQVMNRNRLYVSGYEFYFSKHLKRFID